MAEESRKWLFGLTADEWLHLASDGEDSEVAPCCADLSRLREVLRDVMAWQDETWARLFAPKVLEAYDMALNHDLNDRESFPLLHHVLDNLRRLRGINSEAEERKLIEDYRRHRADYDAAEPT